MLKHRYQKAPAFAEYVEATEENHDLWVSLRRRAIAPADLVARVRALPGRWHLLALSEDWCGDAVNSLPHIAALAEAAGNVELRVLGRDQNPDLMDAHLTNGARSIPVVIILDAELREAAWWGPRPAELQRWAMGEGRALPPKERYREIRTWYARDRGRTVVEEVVVLLEAAARAAGDASAA